MSFFRLYGRVLEKLGSDRRLGWSLALANVALAMAQFAEPVLFGRVINLLAQAADACGVRHRSQPVAAAAGVGRVRLVHHLSAARWSRSMPTGWRTAAASRCCTDYFEHVLQLPLAYHGDVHSGRLMKIMLQGTDALWALWLGFFRDHLAAFVSLLILVPLALFINWRLAILLIVLCVLFAVLTTLDLAQDRNDAAHGANPSFRSGRARLRRAGQYRPGAKFCARRAGGDGAQECERTGCWRRNFPVLSLVGGGGGAHARVDDADRALDHPARHLAVPARPDHRSARSSPSWPSPAW